MRTHKWPWNVEIVCLKHPTSIQVEELCQRLIPTPLYQSMGSSSIVVSNLEGSAPKTPGLALRLQALDEGTMLPAHLTVDASTKSTASDSHGGNGGCSVMVASPPWRGRPGGRSDVPGASAGPSGSWAPQPETIGMWGLSNFRGSLNGVSINGGTDIAGWFISWKIL